MINLRGLTALQVAGQPSAPARLLTEEAGA
jgi:hypothetical protein